MQTNKFKPVAANAEPQELEHNIETGGGGSTVVPNPELEGTEPDLTGLEVNGEKFKIPEGSSGGLNIIEITPEMTIEEVFQKLNHSDEVPLDAVGTVNAKLSSKFPLFSGNCRIGLNKSDPTTAQGVYLRGLFLRVEGSIVTSRDGVLSLATNNQSITTKFSELEVIDNEVIEYLLNE